MANLMEIADAFNQVVSNPVVFVNYDENVAVECLRCTKDLFDFMKRNEKYKDKLSPLNELLVDNFTDEQIWQEIELQNRPLLKLLRSKLQLLSENQKWQLLSLHDTTNKDGKEVDNESISNNSNGLIEGEELVDTDDQLEMVSTDARVKFVRGDNPKIVDDVVHRKKKDSRRRTVVDDKFFKLAEMENFLRMEDEKERKSGYKDENDDNDDIVVSADSDSDDDDEYWQAAMDKTSKLVGKGISNSAKTTEVIRYEDFFDPPSDQEDTQGGNDTESQAESVSEDAIDVDLQDMEDEDRSISTGLKRKLDESNSDTDGRDDKPLSMHETRQQRMTKFISEHEEASLSEKPWQLTGEISARQRPRDSLLDEDLMFDFASNKLPVITEEKTQSLEDLIKQRIKDEAWDDVERKEKPIEQPFEYRKRIELDHEKSKLSLSEIYEKEYIKQNQNTSKEECQETKEAKELMKMLFAKLDALSNFHFTPKPPKKEVSITVNTPAIEMEEVAPITTSEAALLAPEEIKQKSRTEVKGDSEKTVQDKFRQRKLSKKRQKLRAKQINQKKKLLDKRSSKKEAIKQLQKGATDVTLLDQHGVGEGKKSLSSSTAFFNKLQENIVQSINDRSKKKVQVKKKLNASSVKL